MCAGLKASLKTNTARATGLPHNAARGALVQPTIDGTRDIEREAGYRRNGASTSKVMVEAEERAETTRGAAGGRCDGSIALANVAVGGTGRKAWCLRVKGFHVGHALFHAQGVGELTLWCGRREERRRCPR